MLRHVISWTLVANDEEGKRRDAATISAALEGLVPLIPEIHSLKVGVNEVAIEGNWDLVLLAEYDDEKALRAYIDHPEHQRVVAIIRPLVSKRASVDFLV